MKLNKDDHKPAATTNLVALPGEHHDAFIDPETLEPEVDCSREDAPATEEGESRSVSLTCSDLSIADTWLDKNGAQTHTRTERSRSLSVEVSIQRFGRRPQDR